MSCGAPFEMLWLRTHFSFSLLMSPFMSYLTHAVNNVLGSLKLSTGHIHAEQRVLHLRKGAPHEGLGMPQAQARKLSTVGLDIIVQQLIVVAVVLRLRVSCRELCRHLAAPPTKQQRKKKGKSNNSIS